MTKVGAYTVPWAVQHIVERILSSRSAAVDEESTTDALPVQEATWERAVTFLLTSVIGFWRTRQILPPMPTISADLEGGIDVVWRFRHRSLYLNIPDEPTNVVTFYGRDQKSPDLRFGGEEDLTNDGEWILGWLVR